MVQRTIRFYILNDFGWTPCCSLYLSRRLQSNYSGLCNEREKSDLNYTSGIIMLCFQSSISIHINYKYDTVSYYTSTLLFILQFAIPQHICSQFSIYHSISALCLPIYPFHSVTLIIHGTSTFDIRFMVSNFGQTLN